MAPLICANCGSELTRGTYTFVKREGIECPVHRFARQCRIEELAAKARTEIARRKEEAQP